MTKRELSQLKEGRPGSKLLVKGTVRTLGQEVIEVQFDSYSIWIPLKDIIVPGKKKK
jgi:hypothetical protein